MMKNRFMKINLVRIFRGRGGFEDKYIVGIEKVGNKLFVCNVIEIFLDLGIEYKIRDNLFLF